MKKPGLSEERGGAEQEPETGTQSLRMIRVMVADDHPIVREGIRRLLALEKDIEVVAEAGDGHETLEKLN